jgi:YHS domain-containing protein
VIGLLLRLLFVLFVLRSLLRLARGIVLGMQPPPAPKPPAAVPLVRDPVCGTYVVAAGARSAGSGAQTTFFCSENCRRTYLARLAREQTGARALGRAPETSAR